MRRRISMLIVAMAYLLLTVGIAGAQGVTPQTLLPGATIPKFQDPLPVAGDISVVDATAATDPAAPPTNNPYFPYNITMSEFKANILPANAPTVPAYAGSWVWGYLLDTDSTANPRKSYLGPVVVAKRGVETRPTYINGLPYGPPGGSPGSNVQYLLPTDQTLDWADPLGSGCVGQPPTGTCGSIYLGPQPDAVHLHGGEVEPAYDGGPEAWWLPINPITNVTGAGSPATPGAGQAAFIYPTQQQAGTIWFHPHGFGVTRLNVYAGMAGAYIITDPPNEPPQATNGATPTCPTTNGISPSNFGGCLPKFPEYDIPIIIQDRSFDTTGQIFYNLASNPQPNPTVHPFWIPEFIGDTIVVNGKTWPYLNVEPRKYRFRLLNGSNARFYDLTLNYAGTAPRGGSDKTKTVAATLPFTAIATEQGYLSAPVVTPNVIIAPGERYGVIIDFSAVPPGTVITMMNSARTPFPGGARVVAGTTDTVMQFRVNVPLNTAIADATPLPTSLRPNNPIVDIKTPAVAALPAPGACPTAPYPGTNTILRQLTLNEVIGPGGPLELVLNNTKYNGSASMTSQFGRRESEQPAVGDTEVWEIINITADAHPIHTHLASFQLLNRQALRATPWTNAYAALLAANGVLDGQGPPNLYLTQNADCAIGGNPAIGPYLQGAPTLPLAYENGWKDTVIAYPGEVTRFVIRWAETDRLVGTVSAGNLTAYPFNPTTLIGGIGYVWHCHILDHEDNEMMRPYIVGTTRQSIQ